MTKQILLLCLCFNFLTGISYAQENEEANYSRDLGNKESRKEWLKDAGFGMFIHFGMDSQLGIVISHSLVNATDDYVDRYINELPATFNPTAFDPDKIAYLAKLAGMKYVVFTTKHHSGFCMWDTRTTDFNIMNTPYGKDLLKEYVQAMRKEGLGVGFYYSPEDFHFLYENGQIIRRRGWQEALTPALKDKYHAYIRAQCSELMTNYGDVDVFFLDGEFEEPAKETAWELQPDVLVTRGELETPEQTVPGNIRHEAWESNLTMGTQWQFKPTNENYKDGTRLLEILIEVRAKGGAMLLNIGPKPDGSMPVPQENRLREIAAWHFINGESIHDVRPWVVSNEKDIWFTRDKASNAVYAFLLNQKNWDLGERRQFVFRSLKATPETQISVLGQLGKVLEYVPEADPKTTYDQYDDSLVVSVMRAQRIYNNKKWPNPLVLKLEQVEPTMVPPKVRTKEVTVRDNQAVVTLEVQDMGDTSPVRLGVKYRIYPGFVEQLYHQQWAYSEDMLQVDAPGEYSITIDGLEKRAPYQFQTVARRGKIEIGGNIIQK
jgi:alpha-L-fucosidase